MPKNLYKLHLLAHQSQVNLNQLFGGHITSEEFISKMHTLEDHTVIPSSQEHADKDLSYREIIEGSLRVLESLEKKE